jgi:hypothetical protein
MRKMAKDSDGDSYVAERSVGDATITVLTGTIRKERRGDTAIWLSATYTVTGPDGEAGADIIRNAHGLYDVPDKGAARVGLVQAVAIALGLEAPPPAPAPRRRTVPGADGDLEAALTASLANAKPGPVVIAEPRENWELKQGDRIMRHLALYPGGVDPATMSAGMHDMPTTKIRAHLRRLMKDSGPVVEVEPGRYARRPTGPGQPG